jgi:hypothetical protein
MWGENHPTLFTKMRSYPSPVPVPSDLADEAKEVSGHSYFYLLTSHFAWWA